MESSRLFLLSLHYFFVASHVLLILFVLFGWMFTPARKAHLMMIALTALSWFVLGIKYGFGYCFWTDWHWQILHKLGETNLPPSFVEYALEKITARDWNTALVDWTTGTLFFLAALLSLHSKRNHPAT